MFGSLVGVRHAVLVALTARQIRVTSITCCVVGLMAACGGKIRPVTSDSNVVDAAADADVSFDGDLVTGDATVTDGSFLVDGSGVQDGDVVDSDSSVASDSGSIVDSGVADTGVFVPPACALIAGSWLWIDKSVTSSGCGLTDCGHDALDTCTGTSFMTGSVPGPGRIHWAGTIAGLAGEFDGTIDSSGVFTAVNTIVPTITMSGSIDAACNLAARITANFGACSATIDQTGFTL